MGVILAAGRSTRFGPADKLAADLGGKPLAAYAAAAMAALPLTARAAVSGSDAAHGTLFGDGFQRLRAPAGAGQAASLAAAAAFARDKGATDLLLVLADMPLITVTDMAAVLERAADGRAAAVTDGQRRMPPACFPSSDFDALAAQDGDRGARGLLSLLGPERLISLPEQRLLDVDTEEDLARARTALS